jgi:hypothetical protein
MNGWMNNQINVQEHNLESWISLGSHEKYADGKCRSRKGGRGDYEFMYLFIYFVVLRIKPRPLLMLGTHFFN